MPGGNTRVVSHYLPYPVALSRAKDTRVWDVDGNEYIDLVYNYTTFVHGHGFPPVVAAMEYVLNSQGAGLPAVTVSQLELAELICRRVPSAELVRFMNCGTEAAMYAARLARHVTGRSRILKARFGYHGGHDDFQPGSPAVRASFDPRADVETGTRTLLAPFGDAKAFETVLLERGTDIAAVFLEPVMGSAGIIGAPPEFFARFKRAAQRAGAVLVFDEVISLRLAEGGAQQLLGVTPDLTVMGKIVGGGLPVGALAGSRALMEHFDPYDGPRVGHYGTFNGNPLVCTAGVACLTELPQSEIDRLDVLGARLQAHVERHAAATGLPIAVSRYGSLLNLWCRADVPSGADVTPPNELNRLLHLAGMNRGLYFAPRGTLCLATPMGEDLIDAVGARFGDAIADVARDAG